VAGLGLTDVVSTTVYVTDFADYELFDRVGRNASANTNRPAPP
jgi:enamine deaminase RidA (YjgF/YER057c/UK114 family)